MECYVVCFVVSAIGTLYTVFYALYCWLIKDVEEQSATADSIWCLLFTCSPQVQPSPSYDGLTLLITLLWLTLTILVGAWMFWWTALTSSYRKRIKTSDRNGFFSKRTMMVAPLMLLIALILPTDTLLSVVLMSIIIWTSQVPFCSDFTSFRLLFWRMLSWLLVFSIPWEYVRLYKHQVALQFHRTMNGIPAECQLSPPTLWTAFSVWFRETFTWRNDDPTCLQYHTAMLTEPLWEVTPLMVFVSLVTRCITQPVETMAHSFGVAFRQLFVHIPLQWQPVIMVLVVLVTLLLLIMICGYRIKFPWFLHIEPAEHCSNKLMLGNDKDTNGKLAIQ